MNSNVTALGLLLLVSVALSGCGKKSQDAGSTSGTNSNKQTSSGAVGSDNTPKTGKDRLIGKWRKIEGGGPELVFELSAGGSGRQTISRQTAPASWSVADEKGDSMTLNIKTGPLNVPYKITLTDNDHFEAQFGAATMKFERFE